MVIFHFLVGLVGWGVGLSWRVGYHINKQTMSLFECICCHSSFGSVFLHCLPTLCRFWHSQNPLSGVLVLAKSIGNLEFYIIFFDVSAAMILIVTVDILLEDCKIVDL